VGVPVVGLRGAKLWIASPRVVSSLKIRQLPRKWRSGRV
jgi:hypothetical protein